MATNRDLTWRLGVTDNASGAFAKVGDASGEMADKVGGAISKIGGQIGGELGEILEKGGDAFTKFGEAGAGIGTKLAATGAGIAGIGIALQTLGSADKAAEQQLDAAVTAAGQSIDDYGKQIDAAKSKAEDFGHSGADAQLALAKLTEATGDVSVALAQMTLVENLAAAKHESLVDAATQVSAIFAGNTKVLKQYGIDVKVTAGNVEEFTAATTAMGNKLAGQAAAQTNTFAGAIDSAKQHVIDFAARIGNDVGPAISFFGSALGIVGVGIDLYASKQEHATAASLEAEAAQAKMAPLLAEQAAAAAAAAEEMDVFGTVTAEAAARVEAADAAMAAANEETAASSGLMELATGPVGIALGAVAVAGGLAYGAMKLFGIGTSDAAKPVESLTTALKENQGAFNDQTQAVIGNAAQEKGLFALTDRLNISQTSLTQGLNGNADAYQTNLQRLQALADQVAYHTVTVGRNSETVRVGTQAEIDAQNAAVKAIPIYESLNASVEASTAAAKDQAAAASGGTMANGMLQIAVDNTSDAFKNAANTADDMKNAEKELTDTGLGLEQGLLGVKDSVAAVTDSFKQNGMSLDSNTVKGRANTEQVLDSIDKMNQWVAQQLAANVPIAQVNSQLGQQTAALVATGGQSKTAQGQIQALITQYLQTPGTISTQVVLDDVAAYNALQSLEDKYNHLQGLISAGLGTSSQYAQEATAYNAQTHPHAAGGSLSAGFVLDTMNEQGIEGLRTPSGTVVIPHGQTEQMLNGSRGGGTVNLAVTIQTPQFYSGTSTELGRMLMGELTKMLATNGGQIPGLKT